MDVQGVVCEVEKYEMYPRGDCATMRLPWNEMTYLDAAEWLVEKGRCDDVFVHTTCGGAPVNPRVVGLWATARCLLSCECDMCGNTTMMLLQRSLTESHGTYVLAYYSLGAFYDDGAAVTIDGVVCDQRGLYLHALRIFPTFSMAWNNLAVITDAGDVVDVHGERMTRHAMYVWAIECDERNSLAWCNISAGMEPDTIATINGVGYSRGRLYKQLIRCDPCNGAAYRNLGTLIKPPEQTELYDGRVMTRLDLMLEAFRCDPTVGDLRGYMMDGMRRGARAWTRRDHAVLWGEMTNRLFSTLLLGLERLESTRVLAASHQSMWEDALESWKWADGVAASCDDLPPPS